MKNELISIIVPAYNSEKTIKECLDSLIAQDYPNKEIIVVDDLSSDKTCAIVESYKDIKLVPLKNHLGLPGSVRNAGIDVAVGKYISFIDSDDFWDNCVLTELFKSSVETKEKCLFYGTLDFIGDPSGEVNYHQTHQPFSGRGYYELIKKNYIPMHPVLIEKVILDEAGGFDEDLNLKIAEDYELWLRIAYKYPVKFVPQAKGYYNRHSESSMSQASRIERNQAVLKVLTKIKKLYNVRHKNIYKRLAVINYTIFTLLRDERKISIYSLIKAIYYYVFTLIY